MDWKEILKKLAPTLGAALGGPLAGMAVTALGDALGTTPDAIKRAISAGQLTAEQLAAIQQAEIKLKADEAERGFRFAELEMKDRDSARSANVAGGTQRLLFWMSLLILSIAFGAELRVLFWGYPKEMVDAVLVGRILGLLDSTALQVMAYWYGTSSSSRTKTELLAQSTRSS